MIDVEFIGELLIGILHGPQNKKDTLDDWYQAYEEEFEEKARVETTMKSVMGKLHQALPDIREYRWSRTSDFYSLFLALASHVSEFPLSREQRVKLRETLITFGNEVTSYLVWQRKGAPEDQDESWSPVIRKYGGAVQRAATDVANRRERILQL